MDVLHLPELDESVEVTVSISFARLLVACTDMMIVSHDDFMSRFRITNSKRGDVLMDL